jgi:hypothetical protein
MNDGVSFTPRPTLERATARCLLCRDVRAMAGPADSSLPHGLAALDDRLSSQLVLTQ